MSACPRVPAVGLQDGGRHRGIPHPNGSRRAANGDSTSPIVSAAAAVAGGEDLGLVLRRRGFQRRMLLDDLEEPSRATTLERPYVICPSDSV